MDGLQNLVNGKDFLQKTNRNVILDYSEMRTLLYEYRLLRRLAFHTVFRIAAKEGRIVVFGLNLNFFASICNSLTSVPSMPFFVE